MWPSLVLLFLLLPAAHGAPHPAADLQESFPSVLEGCHRPVVGWWVWEERNVGTCRKGTRQRPIQGQNNDKDQRIGWVVERKLV